MTPLVHPYLHAIFCDDVRQEITGKMLHIGVYSGELITPTYPVLLPKLAVVAHHARPFDDSSTTPRKPESVSLVLDDEVLLELDQFRGVEAPSAPTANSRGHLMTFMMALAPFQLPRPGYLRVKIKCEDGSELLSNALLCRVPTEAEYAAPQS